MSKGKRTTINTGNIKNGVVAGGNINGSVSISSQDTPVPQFTFSLTDLANELEALLPKLKEVASESSHYEALAEVAKAKDAAIQNDSTGVIARLRAAGEWVLEIAKEAGSLVAIEALKQAIGIK